MKQQLKGAREKEIESNKRVNELQNEVKKLKGQLKLEKKEEKSIKFTKNSSQKIYRANASKHSLKSYSIKSNKTKTGKQIPARKPLKSSVRIKQKKQSAKIQKNSQISDMYRGSLDKMSSVISKNSINTLNISQPSLSKNFSIKSQQSIRRKDSVEMRKKKMKDILQPKKSKADTIQKNKQEKIRQLEMISQRLQKLREHT